jgi:hypothetical protein
MNDVDPLTWLALTLQRIANGWPISPDRKTHALELQGLNGLSFALTLQLRSAKFHFDPLEEPRARNAVLSAGAWEVTA